MTNQASKLEFKNPLRPVSMGFSCAVYAARKTDLTQGTQFCLKKGIFASNESNMIFFSKICVARCKCAFRQQACLTYVNSAFPKFKSIESSLFPGEEGFLIFTIIQIEGK
jgi:hypothetical protein